MEVGVLVGTGTDSRQVINNYELLSKGHKNDKYISCQMSDELRIRIYSSSGGNAS